MSTPDAGAPVLRTIAQLYRETPAGFSGEGRGLLVDYESVLAKADAQRGDARQAAEQVLIAAEHSGVLELERHKRDQAIVEKIRVRRENESAFFSYVGLVAPTAQRAALGRWFEAVGAQIVGLPVEHLAGWQKFWGQLAAAAVDGRSIEPFTRDDTTLNEQLRRGIQALLTWQGESLVRMASCVIYDDSKLLARRQHALETCLAEITGGVIASFESVGITETPRTVLIHGPLRLVFPDGTLDCGIAHGPLAVSETDLLRVVKAETTAPRLVTVENTTCFLELARLRCGDLFIATSYPGAGTLLLLRLLPAELPTWHFGDSDLAGFDILRTLRERSGRTFSALHMKARPRSGETLAEAEAPLAGKLLASPMLTEDEKSEIRILQQRGKGRFEQECLGRPTRPTFPYY